MTTKTIPAYLEDERRKRGDDQVRIEEEAARIQLLHHSHHRTAKQSKLELPSPVEAEGTYCHPVSTTLSACVK